MESKKTRSGVRYPEALGEQQLQLGTGPLSPVGGVRALVRKRVLEKLLAREVLEAGVMNLAIANRLKRVTEPKTSINVLTVFHGRLGDPVRM